jgi:hypothetical protein
MSWFNPTIDLGQVPLTGVLTIVLAAVMFYWAMWQVRRDIKELTLQLVKLNTIDVVDARLSNATAIIEDQRRLIENQTERMNNIESGIVELAAATAAATAATAAKVDAATVATAAKVAATLEEQLKKLKPNRFPLAKRRNGLQAKLAHYHGTEAGE